MKYLNIPIMIIMFWSVNIFTQEDEDTDAVELFIYNKQGLELYVKLYPISSVFSKYPVESDSKFKLRTEIFGGVGNPRKGGGDEVIYTVGLDGIALNANQPFNGYFELTQNEVLLIDYEGANLCDGLIGHGLYSLEIYYDGQGQGLLLLGEPIILDYRDLNYPYLHSNGSVDLIIEITDVEIIPPTSFEAR